MDLEDAVSGFQNENQFWEALEETVSQDCTTSSDIDDALRSYLGLVAGSKDQFEEASILLAQCAYKLSCSSLFDQHADYIRRQFIHSLLQEDDADILLITASFLIADAQSTEHIFELLNEEGAFPRLVSLIIEPSLGDVDSVRRLIMQMLYEMSRIQRISIEDLAVVTDEFVQCLFDLIEQVSGNVNDPYHYPVIRVLLVLNEQFMVAAHAPKTDPATSALTNRVVKVLSLHGSRYKTFGENIILLLNREDETSLQLLTLKLLYLLFTTPQTYEYFYTNDLRVLVDILIRNLLDLPEEATSLRHTYLRVLYPLLDHTQLQQPPHYKRNEILKLLTVLGGGQVIDQPDRPDSLSNWSHFEAVDETTKRLVNRCLNVHWLMEPDLEATDEVSSPVDDEASGPPSPVSPSKPLPPALPAPRKLKKRNSSKGSTLTIGQYLAPQLESARQSSLSMAEIATQKEKPGIITPSRHASNKQDLHPSPSDMQEVNSEAKKPEKPPPPKARRSGWGRLKTPKTPTEPLAVEDVMIVASPAEVQVDTPTEIKSPAKPSSAEERMSPTSSADNAVGKPSKKPPPAPKARRWQFKRKESESPITPREPGKFTTNLPSIKTDASPVERSPFSPVEEKTLSPPHSVEHRDGPEEPTSVSEALEEAQAQAVQSIGHTLDNTRISESAAGSGAILESISEQPQVEITVPPRAVLAPPNPAPPRSVPGPQVDLERSPFLSDADLEVGDHSDEDDDRK